MLEVLLADLVGLKCFYANQLIYSLTPPTIKISILVSYYRLFKPLGWFRNTAYVVGGLIVAWAIAFFLAAAFQCSPVAAGYDKSLRGQCLSLPRFAMGNGVSVSQDQTPGDGNCLS